MSNSEIAAEMEKVHADFAALIDRKKGRNKNMSVRAKFQVQKITHVSWQPNAREITLAPMYDTSIPEDKRFSDATPSGEFKMYVNNPAAVEQLELGKFFYIDLTPVEDEA